MRPPRGRSGPARVSKRRRDHGDLPVPPRRAPRNSGNYSDFPPPPPGSRTHPARCRTAAFPSGDGHPGTPPSAPGLPRPCCTPESLGESGGAISFFQLVSSLYRPIQTVTCTPPREGESSPDLPFNFCARVAHILLFEADVTLGGAPRGLWGPRPPGVRAGEGVGTPAAGGGGEAANSSLCRERRIMGRREIANLKPRTAGDTRQPNLTNGSPSPAPPPAPPLG